MGNYAVHVLVYSKKINRTKTYLYLNSLRQDWTSLIEPMCSYPLFQILKFHFDIVAIELQNKEQNKEQRWRRNDFEQREHWCWN